MKMPSPVPNPATCPPAVSTQPPPVRSSRAVTLVLGASLLASLTASAAWTTIDTFETRSPGDINGQGAWLTSSATAAVVVADPSNSANQVLHRTGNGGASNSDATLRIEEVTSATFFLRVRRASAANDEVFGLSDVANPNLGGDFSVYEVQSGVFNTTLRLRDGGTTTSPVNTLIDTWYNIWMVVDNTTDTWRLFVQSHDDPNYVNQTEIFSADGTTDFRNGVAPNAIVSFLAKCVNNAATSVFYDDLYLDPDGANLTHPAGFPVSDEDTDGDGLPDFWELRHFQDLTQTGTDDPDGDGFNNAQEFEAGSDPNDPASVPADIDGDGLPDEWEMFYFQSITAQDGQGDPDGDFANNLIEFQRETDPGFADSWPDADGNGLNDGWEIHYFGSTGQNPTADPDGDGFNNLQEMNAGSSPIDGNWTPQRAVLAHRWSFNGSLEDSVGNSPATIVDPDNNPAVGGDATLGADAITLAGGDRATSAYISLGSNLLQGKRTPVTIELWATQHSVQNWSRIFDFGSSTSEALFMSWTQGTNPNLDRVSWSDRQTTDRDNSNAPYTLGTRYHIVFVLEPAFSSGGTLSSGTRVTWYAAPGGSASLGGARGTFESQNHLVDFSDINNWLGRSQWPDATANASYDEVRIWNGALTQVERDVFHSSGPGSIAIDDADGDGLIDQWEIQHFGNITAQDGTGDPDGDGFNNLAEQNAGSDPTNPASIPGDIDGDGLGDEWEVIYFGNLSANPDDDPDGDGDTNLEEFLGGTDPTNRFSFVDEDNDGMPDNWERQHFGVAWETQGANDDFDNDDLTNFDEFDRGTNPAVADTDGDGLSDGDEVNVHFTDPLNPDSDGDGLTDGEEVNGTRNTAFGYEPTNPLLADTDGDSFGDGFEIDRGSNPNDPDSVPVQPTGFTLVEDFEGTGMTIGQTFHGVNGWFAADPANATVVANPAAAGQSGQWVNGSLRKSLAALGLQIGEGQTGTMFLQIYLPSNSIDHSYGLSDIASPTGFGDFEAQFATVGTNMGPRSDTGFVSRGSPTLGTWMNVWIVANNSSDTFKVWVESPLGQTGQIDITADGTFVFRNGQAANALVSLLFVENTGPVNVLLDNIHVDPTAQNLTNPLATGTDLDGDGMDDAWEETYFGNTDQAPDDDFDNDGTSNIDEFRLGLIPNDASSFFAARRSANGQLQWPGKTGLTFTIERSTTLAADSWQVLEAAYPGTAGTTTYTDPAPPAGRAFYRIRLNSP